jgi:hypothetical protein
VDAAGRRTIFAWMDLNIPFYATYFVEEEREEEASCRPDRPHGLLSSAP